MGDKNFFRWDSQKFHIILPSSVIFFQYISSVSDTQRNVSRPQDLFPDISCSWDCPLLGRGMAGKVGTVALSPLYLYGLV